MKPWIWLVILFIVAAGLASCKTESSPETPADPDGPALIMFYTDN